MHPVLLVLLGMGAACATESGRPRVTWSTTSVDACRALPTTGPAEGFRHVANRISTAFGHPRNRGMDMIGSTNDLIQLVEGQIGYGPTDKSLEDEEVEVFACVSATWYQLGRVRTDNEGHFVLALSSSSRIPRGLRPLWISVVGDRSGVASFAYVAPPGTAVVVSDVDGTLTSSENAIVMTILLGWDVGIQPGARTAFRALASRGYQPIYLTARGSGFIEATRRWLVANDMPLGPIIHATGWLTLPGGGALAHKNQALTRLRASTLDIVSGIGNRATDIEAYRGVGISPDHIWIKTPEYRSELIPRIQAGDATGFETYDELRTRLLSTLPDRQQR